MKRAILAGILALAMALSMFAFAEEGDTIKICLLYTSRGV